MTNNDDEVPPKKLKLDVCVACLGLFDFVDEVVKNVKTNESLQEYEVKGFLTSFSLPVSLDFAQLQLWLALLEKFPEQIDSGESGAISLRSENS